MSQNNDPNNKKEGKRLSRSERIEQTFNSFSKMQKIVLWGASSVVVGLHLDMYAKSINSLIRSFERHTPSYGIAYVPNAQGEYVDLSEVFGQNGRVKPCEMTPAPFQPAKKSGGFSLN